MRLLVVCCVRDVSPGGSAMQPFPNQALLQVWLKISLCVIGDELRFVVFRIQGDG